jgi:tetratricopeptide (TPR) repeat protein
MMENFYHELAYQNLGVNKRNLNYAMTYLNKGLEYLPNSAQLLYDKGRIFQMAGRASDAQTFIQRAQAIQPQIGQNE